MKRAIKPVPHLISDSIELHRDKTALRYRHGDEYKGITYGEMGEKIKSFATGLVNLGLEERKIAIVSENRPEWPVAEYAVMSNSGIFVPIYERLVKDDMAYILHDSDASAIVVSNSDELKKILDIRKNAPGLQYIITLNGERDYLNDVIQMREIARFGERLDAEKARRLYDSLSLKTPAKIIYTSGTTGVPKGALFNHLAISYNAKASVDRLGIDENDSTVSFLPLAHSFEANNQNVMLFSGGTIAYSTRKDMPRAMREVRPTLVAAAPLVFEKIYGKIPGSGKKALKRYVDATEKGERPDILSKALVGIVSHKLRKKTGGNIRFFISGGAALDPELSRYFEALSLPVAEGYGETEFCPVIAVNDPKNIKHGYVGLPLSLVVKDESGNSYGGVHVKLNGDGELMVKGPSRMTEYWKKPEDTQKAIEGEWLRTGDIAEISPDGNLKITGRKKRIAKLSTGEGVPLDKIEGRINAMSQVMSVVIANDKRPYPVALIFPSEEGVHLERDAVQKYLQEMNLGLPKHEQIRKFEVIDKTLTEGVELTPTLKVKSRVVEEKYKSVIDKLYSQDV